jgi:ABC-type bacteriocin/lantibiotic exporter with double-glycine peptidase domain
MLIRFLEPSEGEILLGGKNIKDYYMGSMLKYFAYASQSPHLFKISVKENITMGWDHIPLEKIQRAAEIVRINEIIDTLPDKFDTVIGEGGKDLSGGQKQRIILARALIRDPEILLLDEFTSALDKIVENDIVDNILKIFQKQTIICITHSKEVANKFPIVLNLSKDK